MTDFLNAVAVRCDSTAARVAQVLDGHGVPLTPSAPSPRALSLTRLRFEGAKTPSGEIEEPFVYDRALPKGLAAVASRENLAGKSTVLNVVRWALTGRCKLRADVRSWIHAVRLDGVVDGRQFTIEFTDSDEVEGVLREQGRDVERFAGESAFESICGAYFLERLDLDATPFWQAADTDDGEIDGDPRSMGWQAYFPALHVRAGDGPLIGDQTQGGQPGTLMQVYLGLPWALTAATARVALNGVRRDLGAIRRRDAADKKARDTRAEPLRLRLQEVERELATVAGGAVPDPDEADRRIQEFQRLGVEVLTCSRTLAERQQSFAAARDAADAAEAHLRSLRESAALRPLLGRIEPTQCPRCDHDLGSDREGREAGHHCFVCDAPIESGEEDESARADAERALSDALAAAEEADREQSEARDRLAAATSERDRVAALVRELNDRAPAMRRAEELRREKAVAEALLAQDDAMRQEDERTARLREADRILAAAQAEAEARRTTAAGEFRARLGEEIVLLGRRFGVQNLTTADPKLNAHLRVTIGGAPSNFGDLTPGEKLRLRIAVLVGMLRIGHRLGIGRFPGMLLIDSPGSEEMVRPDAAEIVSELRALCDELDGLQVIVASARPDLLTDLDTTRMLGADDLGKVF